MDVDGKEVDVDEKKEEVDGSSSGGGWEEITQK